MTRQDRVAFRPPPPDVADHLLTGGLVAGTPWASSPPRARSGCRRRGTYTDPGCGGYPMRVFKSGWFWPGLVTNSHVATSSGVLLAQNAFPGRTQRCSLKQTKINCVPTGTSWLPTWCASREQLGG